MRMTHYNRDMGRSFINHSAEVTAEPGEKINVGALSIQVGYHPAGYGLYNESIKQIGENRYLVTWKTGASCD